MSIQGNDGFLDLENASLRVTGNVHAEGLKVGSVRLQSAATLQSTTVSGNTTTQMVQFTNPTKGFDVTSNIEVGDANLYVDTTTGRVGVGTNAPMGTLDVKGVLNHTQTANVAQITSNSNVVMEYKLSTRDYETEEPRIALTANSDRGYVASASSQYDTDYQPFEAFNYVENNLGDRWISANLNNYSGGGGAYNGTARLALGTPLGEFIKIELPYKFLMTHVYIVKEAVARSPEDFKVYGSNDDTSWDELISKTGFTLPLITDSGYELIDADTSTTYYKYFAIVITRTHGSNTDYTELNEIRYYGTPFTANVATGTDMVLHTTPNVPKLDFSNVYYDGQDYTSMPATVADKSGNGVTGTPSGGVGFDTTYKAFTFDGVDDQITATLTNPAGAWVHSTSMWFKVNSLSAANTLFSIDNNTTGDEHRTPIFDITTGGILRYEFWGNAIYFGGAGTIVPNKWYHVSVTYSGGSDTSSRRVFLNGVELGISSTVGTIAALNAHANAILKIGVYPASTFPFNGSIANFRLYNNALSADEIWELYAYQKEYFGVSPDVVTLKAGRVGIGTSEPKAVLDVRGDIHATGSLNPVAGMWKQTINSTTVSTTIIKNIGSCVITKGAVGYGAGSNMSGTAGAFVAPYDGVYQFQFVIFGENTGSNLLLIFKASGPSVSNSTWDDTNVIPSYQEVVDLRGVTNEQEPHGFSTLLNLSKDDTVEVDIHSGSFVGSSTHTGSGYVRCSCFLAHRY